MNKAITKPPSLKQLLNDKLLHRGASMLKEDVDNLVVCPRNVRDYKHPNTVAHIDKLVTAMKAGVVIPPMAVKVNNEGKLEVVEGGCRLRAYRLFKAGGGTLGPVDVVNLTGVDADLAMLRWNDGLPFTTLEKAMGIKLRAETHNNAQIAKDIGLSPARVGQLLLLANAAPEIREAVSKGDLKADEVIKHLQKVGQDATPESLGIGAEASPKQPKPMKIKPGLAKQLADAVGPFWDLSEKLPENWHHLAEDAELKVVLTVAQLRELRRLADIVLPPEAADGEGDGDE